MYLFTMFFHAERLVFTAYTYNTCLLAIWPLCKFEIRAVLKKSEADWLRSYLSLNCIEMITFPEFLIFSSLLCNDGLTEISGNTVLSYRRNFRSQAFLRTRSVTVNIFSFLWILCSSGPISRIEKKTQLGKKW